MYYAKDRWRAAERFKAGQVAKAERLSAVAKLEKLRAEKRIIDDDVSLPKERRRRDKIAVVDKSGMDLCQHGYRRDVIAAGYARCPCWASGRIDGRPLSEAD